MKQESLLKCLLLSSGVAGNTQPPFFFSHRFKFNGPGPELNFRLMKSTLCCMSKTTPGVRYGEVDRETNETKIRVVVDMDGGSRCDVDTGIPFFDHMLHQLAFHGLIDLGVQCEGDLEVDDHHTVEDVGIAMGKAFLQTLDPAGSIQRFASGHFAMDGALVLVALDICGRPTLTTDFEFKRESIGGLSTENVKEFLGAFASHSKISLHVRKVCGDNDHHVIEAIFKGLGICLHNASEKIERRGVGSTKGKL